jgi:hypothetical protein
MTNFMEKTIVERVGNWYNVKVDNVIYEVLVQKEDDHTILCDPSSVIVFEKDTFKPITDSSICDKVQEMFENIDWEYDFVSE